MNSANIVAARALPAGQAGETSRQHSLWTLAALGFLAYYITVMWHECLGHGLASYLLMGSHKFTLTSTSMYSSDVSFDPRQITLGGRLVLLAGPLSNGALGLVLYALYRFSIRANASLTLRYFLWLLTALNFFLGFVYMFYSGVFGFGDYALAIESLPNQALIRVLEVIIATLLCTATVRFFAHGFAGFPENLWRLSLVPYISATLVFCVAGLRVPNAAYLMAVSVIPAALLGQAILVFVTPVARRLRVAVPPPQAIPASPAVLFVALVFVVVILLTAPGVHFTIP